MERFLSDDLYAYANNAQQVLMMRVRKELKTLIFDTLSPHLHNRDISVYNYDGVSIYVSNRKGNSTAYDLNSLWSSKPERWAAINPELWKVLEKLCEEVENFITCYQVPGFKIDLKV